MADLTHLFKVGQKVIYRNNDFDAVKRNIPCIVKETHADHIIITDMETNTDLWIEEGFNMDCVFPMYNFQEVKTMQKQTVEFAVETAKDGTITIGKSVILQPKTNYN